jgi:hypothetical protein
VAPIRGRGVVPKRERRRVGERVLDEVRQQERGGSQLRVPTDWAFSRFVPRTTHCCLLAVISLSKKAITLEYYTWSISLSVLDS